jgi:prefoldin subunit 5
MKEEQISKAFDIVADNIEDITKNQKEIFQILEEVTDDIEQIRKQVFVLTRAVQALNQEINNLR